jgi:hypothetical protein
MRLVPAVQKLRGRLRRVVSYGHTPKGKIAEQWRGENFSLLYCAVSQRLILQFLIFFAKNSPDTSQAPRSVSRAVVGLQWCGALDIGLHINSYTSGPHV